MTCMLCKATSVIAPHRWLQQPLRWALLTVPTTIFTNITNACATSDGDKQRPKSQRTEFRPGVENPTQEKIENLDWSS